MHARRVVGQRLVALVQLGVLRARYRVVGVALGLGELVHQARPRMVLACQVLELRHPRVRVIVGVVHHRHRLVL